MGQSPLASPQNRALAPGLYLVSTPIGNLRDITLRAIDVLHACDLILAEDTRVARKLFLAHGIHKKPAAYHEHNADRVGPGILAELANGARVALISDAGTPLVSDPGGRLVAAAIKAGVNVSPIPGASAVLAAVTASGLPAERFMFCGFPPAKPGARAAFFAKFAAAPCALVFFETGPRLAASLGAMAHAYPGRHACVARELTKIHEEYRRDAIEALAAHYGGEPPPKGEIVVLVGAEGAKAPDRSGLEDALESALEDAPLKVAAQRVARDFGLPRKEVYALGLRRLSARGEGEGGEEE